MASVKIFSLAVKVSFFPSAAVRRASLGILVLVVSCYVAKQV